MTLSEITHATVGQCDDALNDLADEYGKELALIREVFLLPVRKKMRARNAEARSNYERRKKKLLAYRAILAGDQPIIVELKITGGPTDGE